MKIALWSAAILIVSGLLLTWPWHRGDPRILRGRLTPRLLRMVVLILIMLGAGRDAEAQTRPSTGGGGFGGFGGPGGIGDAYPIVPLTVVGKAIPIIEREVPRSKTFPGPLTEEIIRGWAFEKASYSRLDMNEKIRELHTPGRAPSGNNTANSYVQAMAGNTTLPASLRALLAAELEGVGKPEVVGTIDDVAKAAADVTAAGLYRPWIIAYLWSKAPADVAPGDAAKLASVYSQIEDLLRADNALRLAQVRSGPIQLAGWGSKAGPRPTAVGVPPGLINAATAVYPTTDAGLFETDGTLSFRLPKDGPGCTLYRRNQKVELQPGDLVHLRRLDILVTGEWAIAIEHRTLGTLELPAHTVITARNASRLLGAEASKKIAGWISGALEGDPDAAHLLEMVLPCAIPAIKAELAAHASDQVGALRMLVESFEE